MTEKTKYDFHNLTEKEIVMLFAGCVMGSIMFTDKAFEGMTETHSKEDITFGIMTNALANLLNDYPSVYDYRVAAMETYTRVIDTINSERGQQEIARVKKEHIELREKNAKYDG